MGDVGTIFERTEKKYILSEEERAALLTAAGDRLRPDAYPLSEIGSLYFDTPDRRMIRASIDADCYKEKLRLRAYGTPGAASPVFLEMKKKYRGIVYKRRECMTLAEARRFLEDGISPRPSQILSEIAWMMRQNPGIAPAACIFYRRDAWVGDGGLRVTFDHDVLFRGDDLSLEHGAYGERVLDASLCILELKAPGAMPFWMSELLDAGRIYPASFSKYGTAYKKFGRSAQPDAAYREALHA